MIKGVDVSQYQSSINWPALKNSVDFAIIKSTGGCPDPGQPDSQYLDPHFETNKTEARNSGILHGFYHFSYPQYNTPEAEAEYVARVLSDIQPGEIVALDFEEAYDGDSVAWCLAWLNKAEQLLGFKPLLYINLALAKAHDWQPVISAGYGLWLAEWTFNDNGVYDTSQPWPMAAFMQYSDKGQVSGIPTTVDLDLFFGDAAQFQAYGKPQPAQPLQPTIPAPVEITAELTPEQPTEVAEPISDVPPHNTPETPATPEVEPVVSSTSDTPVTIVTHETILIELLDELKSLVERVVDKLEGKKND
jgi:GH25 family lysozyme M1 (1,4-beta-N-acetylmuramidase)